MMSAAFGFQPVQAQTTDAQLVEKARAGVLKMGTGEKARVEVKLRDNTKLKGYISEAGDDSFAVTDANTGTSRTIAYTDVAQVKKRDGALLSTQTKIIIGASAAIAAGITLYVIRGVFCDGQC